MLEGNSIYLVPIGEHDTENIIRWRNSDFVREWFIYQKPLTAEEHMNWLKTVVETGKAVQFIIYVREGNRAVGSVYLRGIDCEHEKAEFGIYIGEKDCVGKSVGAEATELVTAYGFEQLGLHKITLRVLADNERARRSYGKAGFVEEGYLRDEVKLHGTYRDVVFMAKFREGHI